MSYTASGGNPTSTFKLRHESEPFGMVTYMLKNSDLKIQEGTILIIEDQKHRLCELQKVYCLTS